MRKKSENNDNFVDFPRKRNPKYKIGQPLYLNIEFFEEELKKFYKLQEDSVDFYEKYKFSKYFIELKQKNIDIIQKLKHEVPVIEEIINQNWVSVKFLDKTVIAIPANFILKK
jgi:hypothetical protein